MQRNSSSIWPRLPIQTINHPVSHSDIIPQSWPWDDLRHIFLPGLPELARYATTDPWAMPHQLAVISAEVCCPVVRMSWVPACSDAHLVEDQASDYQEEQSRHKPREQGGDEPWRHWRRRKQTVKYHNQQCLHLNQNDVFQHHLCKLI